MARQEQSLNHSQEKLWTSARRFVGTFVQESRQGTLIGEAVRDLVVFELGRQGVDTNSPELATDWDTFEKALLLPRPRRRAAIAAYATLTGKDFQAVNQQQGMLPAKAFWMLGTMHDDLLDVLDKDVLAKMSEQERMATLHGTLFGEGREFQRATQAAIMTEISTNPAYGQAKVQYLQGRMNRWFDFLLTQESEVYTRPDADYTFTYCRDYRERQNGEAGRVVVAFLNGAKCLDPEQQRFEDIVPVLSYRTQIMDDIGDLTEDLEMRRPSYMVGALRDHPDEFARVQQVIDEKKIKKFSPHKVKKYAPKSYNVVKDTFLEYGEDLVKEHGLTGEVLDKSIRAAFHAIPVARDIMHRVNPRYSYF